MRIPAAKKGPNFKYFFFPGNEEISNSISGNENDEKFPQKTAGIETKFHSDFGMNPAKRYCCDKAEGEMCRQLCHKSYTNDWLYSSRQFEMFCQDFWTKNLRQCLQDADSVCEYGCESRMQFCDHYNKQFRLFRNCNRQTDIEARQTYTKWLSGNIFQNSIVPGIVLHFRNMTLCRPEAWKRLACHLHVQPCVSSTHSSNICRFVYLLYL